MIEKEERKETTSKRRNHIIERCIARHPCCKFAYNRPFVHAVIYGREYKVQMQKCLRLFLRKEILKDKKIKKYKKNHVLPTNTR